MKQTTKKTWDGSMYAKYGLHDKDAPPSKKRGGLHNALSDSQQAALAKLKAKLER